MIILAKYVLKWSNDNRQAFSMTPSRGRDMARLTLIGNLTREPESRLTKNDKEFIVYVIILLASGYFSTRHIVISYTVVTNGPQPPADANGGIEYHPSIKRNHSF
jgi:hypothetical protein